MNWLTFAYSLPSGKKSSARVTLWRRLQRLGAVAPAGNMYFLPAQDDCEESFEWLAQEVRQAGGQAIVTHVSKIGGMTDEQLVAVFCVERDKAYQLILDEAAGIEEALSVDPTAPQLTTIIVHLSKLRNQQRECQRIDYFNCASGKVVQSKLQQLEQKLMPADETIEVDRVDSAEYLNKTWVTRPKPHVDRLASIWLIRRFIDPNAQFRFTTKVKAGDVSFDMPGADFGHTGSLCTFETILAAFDIEAPSLKKVAEIVHEIDLHDGRYFHPEVAGLDAVLQGWRESPLDDEALMAHGIGLFDGLLRSLAH